MAKADLRIMLHLLLHLLEHHEKERTPASELFLELYEEHVKSHESEDCDHDLGDLRP